MRWSRRDPAELDRSGLGWTTWRSERLRTAGFPAQMADQLAREPEVDIHALLELVDRGCRPDLAARIMAPVEAPLDAHEP